MHSRRAGALALAVAVGAGAGWAITDAQNVDVLAKPDAMLSDAEQVEEDARECERGRTLPGTSQRAQNLREALIATYC